MLAEFNSITTVRDTLGCLTLLHGVTYPIQNEYDAKGRLTNSIASITQTYTANPLNQYTARNQQCFTYDPDGNLLSDGTYSYTYDCENRLLSVTPINLQYGSLRILNQYDYKHRRIQKTVETYNNGWHPLRTHTFLYEDWNLILELIQHANNTTTTIEYFWGNDLSGSEQGAGGIGGLIAVSIDGAFYFPTYDNNGNITDYLSESGTFISQVTYTPFGTLTTPTTIPTHLNFHFSTKYLDRETGLYYYGYRFYSPENGRWLNRDPVEEEGGINLYRFCDNDGQNIFDFLGLKTWYLLYYSKPSEPQFMVAASTMEREIKRSSKYNEKCDAIIKKGAHTREEFHSLWKEIQTESAGVSSHKNNNIFEMHLFFHMGVGSVYFEPKYLNSNSIGSLDRLHWKKNARLILHGCNSGITDDSGISTATSFAKSQKIEVLGQSGNSQFSTIDDKRTVFSRANDSSDTLYLWSYGDGGEKATFGNKRNPIIVYPESK